MRNTHFYMVSILISLPAMKTLRKDDENLIKNTKALSPARNMFAMFCF